MRWSLLTLAFALACSRPSPSEPPKDAAPIKDAPIKDAALPDAAGLAEPTFEQLDAFAAAQAAHAAGRLDEARRAYLNAFEGPASGISVSAGLAAANLMEQAGEGPAALALYERLLTLPAMPEVNLTAARAYAEQGKLARAEQILDASLLKHPEFLPSYPVLAAIYDGQGQREKAGKLLISYEFKLNEKLSTLKSPATDPADKVALIDLLVLVPDERIPGALRALLRDPAPAVRMSAGAALAEDPLPETLAALEAAYQGELDGVAKQTLGAALTRAKARAQEAGAAPTKGEAPIKPADAALPPPPDAAPLP